MHTLPSPLHVVRVLKLSMARLDLNLEALFLAAGLDEHELQACDEQSLSDRLSALWSLMVARTGDPLIGLPPDDPCRPEAELPVSMSARVLQALTQALGDGGPLRQVVAARLFVSERTLQRHLAMEGTSFKALLDATRRELARQALVAGGLPLKRLCGRLGFSDPSVLHRACRRWFGATPCELASGRRQAPPAEAE
ncbi:helix-turn-helix transcriptional regulator [Rugamonas apoptosis]|uniref:helix-turn-helix transcriptional regulator n=1 Tax=Rugamonas apoptosis TaxID=2758570 RepID=UPI001E3DCA7D|nr:helix-turn-helix transcriptional regulator [Rugamonas apoptosis]